MTAFLSIQLVLIFSFIGALANQPDLPMNTADTVSVAHPVPMPAADREDAIMIVIQRDAAVWLGNNRVSSAEELRTGIRDAVAQGAERKVYVRADMRARYGTVREVLGTVRSAGVENIGFIVDERK
jgi:biopolymer transport protein TolR